ncbi:hypothetical protein QFZ75_004733 [Streptomyces sp. V3I8]|uniref:DUF397 domain-containing protein n=1 Tax=Streptomyces sp. V3I8 TaxID=3042279 RepID=UPI0027878D39|nr:DUF397 domain-containing protein [Streptomyces sp. V3I8]MDQ1038317.1 hypothetical protein [Streptomyces sp. V3I8]
MSELVWQKSSYSAEAANCLYVAAAPTGTVHLRESDAPDAVLITTRPRLHALIRTLKASPSPRTT